MELRQNETSARKQSEVQASAPRIPERKPRFQIVKLEERIAPSGSRHQSSPHHACGSGGRSC
jgi:hypothetical protein